MNALELQIDRIAQAPRLLVACDYDGVIAPIVPDPARAAPMAEVVDCLNRLAGLRQTDVAVVSGRSLDSLHALIGATPRWHLVGCHGAQWPTARWAIANQSTIESLRPLIDRL